jgi:signal transduction histidine kinase
MPRLYTRIYLHSLVVLALCGLVSLGALVLAVRSAGLGELGERGANHVIALVSEQSADGAALARRLQELDTSLDLNVTVRDRDGRVVAAVGAPMPDPSPSELLAARAGRVLIHRSPAWTAAGPLREPGSGVVSGIVQISARRTWMPLLWPLLVVSAAMVVAAIAARPLARRISRPLERLAEVARRLGAGDLGARAPAPALPDPAHVLTDRLTHVEEIQALTRAFNDMADRIEQLVRGQKELLANVSHELRSPLARIRVALALLPRDEATDARLRDVERDLEDLDRLIEDVLTGARLEATGLGSRLSAVDVRALLQDIADRAEHDPVTAGRGVRVAPSAVPGRFDLDGDAPLLRRALWNLVENAAKYGAPPITLEAATAAGDVLVSVTDEGAGIAEDEQELVLGPFYRQDRARTPRQTGAPSRGFGLGLTLARQIALAHGGAIEIGASLTGDGREHGCRVTIRIPSRRPPSSEDATPS